MQIFVFFILGFFSLVSQAIVLREIFGSFYGNDLFINLAMGSWLFWTGVGCVLGRPSHAVVSTTSKSPSLINVCLLTALVLPLEIFVIRLFPAWLGSPGEIPNLVLAGAICFFLVCPICLLIGIQFNRAVKYFFNKKDNEDNLSFIINRAYFYETVGFIIGGLLFSFRLIFFNELWVVCVLCGLSLLVALALRSQSLVLKRGCQILAGCLLLWAAFFTGTGVLDEANLWTKQLRFGAQKLLRSVNSIYGNISVTRLGEQTNFFETGGLIGTEEETIAAEKLIHLPLSFHRNPKKIMIIGTAFNGPLRELLKYNPDKIYYLELDPAMYPIASDYLSRDLKAALNDSRVHKIYTDPRYFFKYNTEFYDVIIINLPSPSGAIINRCYTEEFLGQINDHLTPDGILALRAPYASNYVNQPLKTLNSCLYKTLRRVFSRTLSLPEDTNLMMGFKNSVSAPSQSQAAMRFKERALPCKFFNENYLIYRLTTDRVGEATNYLNKAKRVKLNKDLFPSAYYYSLLFFISTFHPNAAYWLEKVLTIHIAWVILFLLALFGVIRFRKEWKKNSGALLPAAMATAGFSLMSIQSILILAFQVFFGNLYFRLTLVITSLMIGMGVGARLGLFKSDFIYTKLGLKNFFFLNAFYSLFMLWLLFFEPQSELILYGLAGVIGFLVGVEFNLINQAYFANKNNEKNTGAIYGADLLGSCLGLFFTSFFLIPAMGIPLTLFILGLMNFLMAELIQRKA